MRPSNTKEHSNSRQRFVRIELFTTEYAEMFAEIKVVWASIKLYDILNDIKTYIFLEYIVNNYKKWKILTYRDEIMLLLMFLRIVL